MKMCIKSPFKDKQTRQESENPTPQCTKTLETGACYVVKFTPSCSVSKVSPKVSVVLHKLNQTRIHLLHHESVDMFVMSVADVNTMGWECVVCHGYLNNPFTANMLSPPPPPPAPLSFCSCMVVLSSLMPPPPPPPPPAVKRFLNNFPFGSGCVFFMANSNRTLWPR